MVGTLPEGKLSQVLVEGNDVEMLVNPHFPLLLVLICTPCTYFYASLLSYSPFINSSMTGMSLCPIVARL